MQLSKHTELNIFKATECIESLFERPEFFNKGSKEAKRYHLSSLEFSNKILNHSVAV